MNDLQYKLTRGFLLFICLFITILFLPAQGIGSWRTHLPFYDVTDVVETPNKVFVLASGSLASYSPDDREIKKYSKYDGLNDSDIKFVAYSDEASALFIVYSNCNLDILTNKGVYNFPDIKDKFDIDDKQINGVDIFGKTAYISTSFGFVEFDLVKMESPNSCRILEKTFSICLDGNYIYAATSSGIRRALTSKNLASPDNWELYNPNIEHLYTLGINRILMFKGAMIFQQANGAIFYKTESQSGALSWNAFKDTKIVNDQLVGITSSSVLFWTDLDNKTELAEFAVSGITGRKQNIYWFAQNNKGFGAIKKETNANDYSSHLSNITINSPINNYAFSLRFQNNKLLVTGGKSGSNRGDIIGTFMILKDGHWKNFLPEKINEEVKLKYPEIPSFMCMDFVDAIQDPAHPERYYVSSFGEGLYVFENDTLKELYNFNNSPLLSVLLDTDYNQYHYIRLGGLTFDSDNNLHVGINKRVSPTQILSKDKVWANVPYNIGIYSPPVQTVLITSKKQKWMNFRGNSDLLLIEDNNTPLDFSDDKTAIFQGSIVDQKGESFSFGKIMSIAEDNKGSIWMGTVAGPAILYNPQNAIKAPANFYCTRPILPYSGESESGFYLLDTEQINAIAVDGANRKWLGTEMSGVYLVSENGMEIIHNFTAENSPLLSNAINSIAIDSNTGEVFFATDKGLVSYMGDASAGKESYSEVRAYPNPVRPEYQDRVTIINLIQDSNVKITDARGNLIYQGTSKGGMFTWKCVDNHGERVKTGIYLVFAAKPDGSEGVVTKIMVVK